MLKRKLEKWPSFLAASRAPWITYWRSRKIWKHEDRLVIIMRKFKFPFDDRFLRTYDIQILRKTARRIHHTRHFKLLDNRLRCLIGILESLSSLEKLSGQKFRKWNFSQTVTFCYQQAGCENKSNHPKLKPRPENWTPTDPVTRRLFVKITDDAEQGAP